MRITRTVVKRDPNGNLMDRQKNRYRKSSEQELLEVTLPRGARDKEKIVFRNKGDIQEGMLQGNVVLVVEVADHPFFQRKGADLILSRRVSLFEAITGVTFTIRGIDGELLEVSTPPGMVRGSHCAPRFFFDGARSPCPPNTTPSLFVYVCFCVSSGHKTRNDARVKRGGDACGGAHSGERLTLC